MEERSPNQSSPWSSFHSSVALATRTPGTPIRQLDGTLSPAKLASVEHVSHAEFDARFTELGLLIEYKMLYANCPKGVYVVPSPKSLYEWYGVVFVHSGPFKGGVFRFTMLIPDGFPRIRPMLKFHSKIYHPYIHSSNGSLNMFRGFPQWDPAHHHIWHVIQYMRDCFYDNQTWEECENQTFRDLATTSAAESARSLQQTREEDEESMIVFRAVDESTLASAIEVLLKGELPQSRPGPSSGLLSNVTEQFKQLFGIK